MVIYAANCCKICRCVKKILIILVYYSPAYFVSFNRILSQFDICLIFACTVKNGKYDERRNEFSLSCS